METFAFDLHKNRNAEINSFQSCNGVEDGWHNISANWRCWCCKGRLTDILIPTKYVLKTKKARWLIWFIFDHFWSGHHFLRQPNHQNVFRQAFPNLWWHPIYTSGVNFTDILIYVQNQNAKSVFCAFGICAQKNCSWNFGEIDPCSIYCSIFLDELSWFTKQDEALFTRDILTRNIAIKRYCDKKIFLRHGTLQAKVSS